MATITATRSGFNISHSTREVWGVDDPSEAENRNVGIEMYKTGSKGIWGLTGDRNANTRQTIMFLLTGKKHPKAKCGIHAVNAAVKAVEPSAVCD